MENEQIGPGYDLRRGENITHEGIQPFIKVILFRLKKKKMYPMTLTRSWSVQYRSVGPRGREAAGQASRGWALVSPASLYCSQVGGGPWSLQSPTP